MACFSCCSDPRYYTAATNGTVLGQRAKSVTGDAVHILTIKNPAHGPRMQHTRVCGISLKYGNNKKGSGARGRQHRIPFNEPLHLVVSSAIKLVDYDAHSWSTDYTTAILTMLHLRTKAALGKLTPHVSDWRWLIQTTKIKPTAQCCRGCQRQTWLNSPQRNCTGDQHSINVIVDYYEAHMWTWFGHFFTIVAVFK
jgi:hypothetical protein